MAATESALRLPAEWEKQSGVMLAWPHALSDWQGHLPEIEPVYIALSKAICETEACLILCQDQAHRDDIRRALQQQNVSLERCQLVCCRTNDTWCRDYAPITTQADERLILNNFIFDGWGNKYPANLDNAVSWQCQQRGCFDEHILVDRDFVLEGGSIESDGHGTLMTTSHCLLTRHPDKDRSQIETTLCETLGAQRVLWLDHGSLGGDDTDSHIDNLARFIDADTIAYAACRDENHPDYEALKHMQSQLQSFRKADDTPYQLVPVYLPALISDEEGLLPASYINFLILNDRVLVPIFGQDADHLALATFEQYFPGRQVIGIDSHALIKQYGGIHCATMHFPQGIIQVSSDTI